ncbi:MAG: TonB-dependent receptor, partial [Planctomycetota bacterium]|nr:TonB-dependent receptor [Planctomycetota bacterium]
VSNGRTDTENYSVVAEFRKKFANDARLRLGYTYEKFRLRVRDYPFAFLHNAGTDIDLERDTHALHASGRLPILPIWELVATGGFKEDRLDFERNNPRRDGQAILHFDLGTELRPLDPLILSAGVHLEDDSFSGFDASPRAGAVFRPLDNHSLRASYGIGRRKPSFTETQLAFVVPNPLPPPATLPLFTGNPDINRETLIAYEGGYRGVFEELGLLLDFQVFFHDLQDRIVFAPDPASPVPGALTFANQGKERVFGAELAAEWRVHGPLSLYSTYTYQDAQDTVGNTILRDRPRHKVNTGLRLRFEEGILEGTSAFLNLNYVSRIEQLDGTGTVNTFGDHFRVDFRLARSFLDDRVEVSLIGRNIFDNKTVEFQPFVGSNAAGAFGAERAFFINLALKL